MSVYMPRKGDALVQQFIVNSGITATGDINRDFREACRTVAGTTGGSIDDAWKAYLLNAGYAHVGQHPGQYANFALEAGGLSVRSAASSFHPDNLSGFLSIPETRSAGDVLVGIVHADGSLTPPVGWTQKAIYTNFGTSFVFARVATADSADEFTYTQANNADVIGYFYAVKDAVSSLDSVEASIVANLDPPLLTPSWGENNNLWTTFACDNRATNWDPNVVPPEGYEEGFVQFNSGDFKRMAAGHKVAVAESDNPGLWTGITANWSWRSGTIAVRGA